jgi:hypothetical protein
MACTIRGPAVVPEARDGSAKPHAMSQAPETMRDGPPQRPAELSLPIPLVPARKGDE